MMRSYIFRLNLGCESRYANTAAIVQDREQFVNIFSGSLPGGDFHRGCRITSSGIEMHWDDGKNDTDLLHVIFAIR